MKPSLEETRGEQLFNCLVAIVPLTALLFGICYMLYKIICESDIPILIVGFGLFYVFVVAAVSIYLFVNFLNRTIKGS